MPYLLGYLVSVFTSLVSLALQFGTAASWWQRCHALANSLFYVDGSFSLFHFIHTAKQLNRANDWKDLVKW